MAGNTIGGVIGAIIGFYLGGPSGAVAGWQIGSAVGGAIDPERIDGPRLNDLKVQVSSYGVSIPILYGGDAVAGNVIWSTDLIPSEVEQGKGGPVVTLHEYSVSCAIIIGEGEIAGLLRIWGDAKLLADFSETADMQTQISSSVFATYMTFYHGDEDQLPDPTIEAAKGVGNVTAYRGYSYVVFKNIPLKAFNNRLPSFRFEPTTGTPEAAVVEAVIPLVINAWSGDKPSHSAGRTQYSITVGGVTTTTENLAEVEAVCVAAGYPEYIGFSNHIDEDNIFAGTPTLNTSNGWGQVFLHYNADPVDVVVDVPVSGYDHAAICAYNGGFDPSVIYMFRGDVGAQTLGTIKFTPGEATPPDYSPYGLDIGAGGYCVSLPPVDGYYGAFRNSYGIFVTARRLLSPEVSTACEPGDPLLLGIAQVPGNPDFCISADGTLSANTNYVVQTGTFKQLQALVEVGQDTIAKLPVGPTLLPTDPNYSDQAFWEAEALAAGIGGTYPADYPVIVTVAAGLDYGVSAVGGGSVMLTDIVADVWERAGGPPAQCNVAALDGIVVQGYTIARQMAARQAIVPLQQAYWWDFVESGREIKAVLRGGAAAVMIGLDDLGASESDEEAVAVVPMRAQETELPATVTVSHPLRAKGYEIDTQRDRRVTTGSQQTISVELAVVTTEQHAAEIASVLLYTSWTERTERKWSTTRKYAKYEPTDIVELNDGEFIYRVRIVDRSEEGQIIKWRGVDEAPAVYSPTIVAAPGSGAGAIGSIAFDGPMRLELIDSPILRDSDDDPGFYGAAAGYMPSYSGGVAYRSVNAGASYSNVKTMRAKATIGYATTVLGNYAGGNTVDEGNIVTLTMLGAGTLSSITQEQLLNQGNAAILGNELLHFKRRELIAPGTYMLSGFLRGRQGTEQYMGTHAVGDRFVLFTPETVYRMPGALADIGVAALWKGVPVGQALAQANAQPFTNTGAGLKPLSPTHLHAVDLGGGQYRISWVRRTRIGGKWRDGVDVPLGETSEAYTVVTSTGATINSTTTTGLSTLDVAAAPGDTVQVFQLSNAIGRGFPASVAVL